MHLKTPSSHAFSFNWFPYQFLALGSSKAWGVAIVLSQNLQFNFVDSKVVPRGRFIFIKGIIDYVSYTFASLYAPYTNQLVFLSDTLCQLDKFKSE